MDLGELEREQVHRRHLGDEGLGRRHADLEPRAREQDAVRVAGRLAPHDVGDGEHLGAALAREPHRGERVGGLARLRDPDHEVALAQHRVAVAELGGDIHLDRPPRPPFDRVAADEAGVVGGPAGDDHDAPDVLEELVRDAEVLELDAVRAEPAGERLRHRVGLLVDLLEHERVVATLLGLVLVPVDLVDLTLERRAVGRDEARALRGDRDDLAVVDELDATRRRQEGGDRGRDEALAVADADHQRALLAGADQHVRGRRPTWRRRRSARAGRCRRAGRPRRGRRRSTRRSGGRPPRRRSPR